jgi:type II secretory pathway component PulK
MNKKAQVIIIILWTLVILTILAVTIGHRVSIAMRLSRYQRDSLGASCSAGAGINSAIVVLDNDDRGNDGLRDIWSTGIEPLTNKPLLENIEVKEGSQETFTVSYLYDKDNDTCLCMSDEERKININTADKDLLEALLAECGVANPQELTKDIRLWRGHNIPESSDYTGSGYNNKNVEFSNIEELLLVKGVKETAPQNLEKLMGLITVFSSGLVNINTAPEEVLTVLIKAIIVKSHTDSISADILVRKIMNYRETADFTDTSIGKNMDSVNSHHFRIISRGKIFGSNIERIIECVYDRRNQKIVFWHEN